MVDNILTLRSSIAGNRPPSGRLTGELYLNMAEGQLGFVNASGANQDLLSITMFSTAATYAVGAFVLEAGQLYRCVLPVTTPGAFAPGNWTQVGGSVSVGDTPPGNAQPGALWYDSTAAELYVLYNDGNSTQWVVAVNQSGAYLPLNGGTMTGDIVLRGNATAALNPVSLQQMTVAIPGPSTSMPVMDGTAAIGVSALFARGDHVHPTDTSRAAASALANYLPLAGGTTTGQITSNASPTAFYTAGAIDCGALSATGAVYSLGGSVGSRGTGPAFVLESATPAQVGTFSWNNSNGQVYFSNTQGGGQAALLVTPAFSVNCTPYSPAGGAWSSSSDARIKTVEGDYALGLNEVLALKPVSFHYKGNDTSEPPADQQTAPFKESPHALVTDRTYVGFVAQEAEQVFPGMVTQRKGWIDGVEVDDFRDLDTTPLIYALVNAVKELAARVEALEGAR